MKITSALFVKSAARILLQHTEKEYTIKVPWGNIKALSWGKPSDPPVLLCHGKLDACTSFCPLVSMLPEKFFYVSIDLPGNGLSDHFPKGLRYTVVDFVPTILKVKEFFNWSTFVYIAHSLGVIIGKYYNITHPGNITRFVELDPMPTYFTFEADELQVWYKYYYERFYSDERYWKVNGSAESAPRYTYEKILEMTMKGRGLSKEIAEEILERSVIPVEDGLYRISYDQRLKMVTLPPIPRKTLEKIYTSTPTPTYCFLASQTIQNGVYKKVPFIMDESAWPLKNYKYKIVEGGHNIHIEKPQYMAKEISDFLMAESTK
ncbi:serine hydrolase-like protein 2 [Aphomia sociella]